MKSYIISNTIKDVKYVSRDAKGNEYIIKASEGQIDIKEPNIIYLTGISSILNLNNSNKYNNYLKFW